jgi:hypothetical protein
MRGEMDMERRISEFAMGGSFHTFIAFEIVANRNSPRPAKLWERSLHHYDENMREQKK